MNFIDTHSHLFLEEFAEDLPLVMQRAKAAGVSRIYMPNIDCSTIKPLLDTVAQYPDYCFPMIGLHPTSVNSDFREELKVMKELLDQSHPFVAIGEVGMDLYWDRTFINEQFEAFETQIQWSAQYRLPLVIHSRDSFEEVYQVIKRNEHKNLKGIFHSFTGTVEEAERLLQFDGFYLGINGVVTFKKSTLPEVLKNVPLERIVLETDSPYLTPAPNRGKRNESANVKDTLMKLAAIYQCSPENVADVTTMNALKIFS
ncbi:TatD DNase family protein [Bacteroides luti]|uniref:TatD DNase family protein n=1 Tax=Bacteroides luti TaxID=1297750 RepID=A0A1M5C1F4_9BACE|nr:TatD family hydrolase [Bacteroides luti]SHF48531.1 TatD DNase family protein [Bacteroides luti]